MLDPAHVLTDDMLKDLERRVADQYAIAAREMQQKYEKYMEQYKAGLSAQKEQLAAGKITQQDYDNWVYRHTMMNKRWEDMKDVLASDLQHTREIALKIAGEKIPDIYALNHNYGVYEIEHGGKIDTGLTLYNHDTAEYLLGDQRQLMPGPSDRKAAEIAANKAMQWDKEKIQSCVLQGIMQGESVHEVAKRLQDVAKMEYNAAVRYARTMITSAQNAGRYEAFRRADRLGVKLTIEWNAVLDGRTRHAHRMMHGEQTKVDEPFETPDGYTIYYPADCTGTSDAPQSFIWNCFTGDTKVASDCEIVRSYKHKFKGRLIRVRTAAGVDFTCTPNHPILTPDGWIPAAFLHKGNHLLITRVGDDGSLTRNGNVYHVHSSIKALHDSLESLGNSERISMSNFDFHGDVPTSDVEVISKERLLRNDGNTCGGQGSRKLRFILPNALRLCERHFMLGFRRIYIPALRFVRCCRESLPFFGRRLSHADKHGFRTVSNRDTCVSEYAINDLPTVTNIRSELLGGLAGNVFVDDVVSVDRKPGRLLCHVYNLQTESGYYFVGSSIPQNSEKCNGNYYAIAKNCRCTLLSWVEGYEGDTVKESPGMGDMSFEEWQEAYADYERRGGSEDHTFTPFDTDKVNVLTKTDYSKKTLDEMASLSGISALNPNDVNSVRIGKKSVTVSGDGIDIRVQIDKEENALLLDYMELEHKGQGTGAKVLDSMVKASRAQGLDKIILDASGSYGSSQNGYYTWPRLGFDASLTSAQKEKAKNAGFVAEKISDLMKTEKGRKYWKENGTSIQEAVFDLSKNSKSMLTLEEYLKKKRK